MSIFLLGPLRSRDRESPLCIFSSSILRMSRTDTGKKPLCRRAKEAIMLCKTLLKLMNALLRGCCRASESVSLLQIIVLLNTNSKSDISRFYEPNFPSIYSINPLAANVLHVRHLAGPACRCCSVFHRQNREKGLVVLERG